MTGWRRPNPPPSYDEAATMFGRLAGPVPGDPKTLRRAYLDAASRLHPDVGGDTAAMQALNVAYEVLKQGRSAVRAPSRSAPVGPYAPYDEPPEPPPFDELRKARERVAGIKKRYDFGGVGRTIWEALCEEFDMYGDTGSSTLARWREREFAHELDFYAADAWVTEGRAEARRTKTRKADWIENWKEANANDYWQGFEHPFDEGPYSDEDAVSAFLKDEWPEITAYTCFVCGSWADADPTALPHCPACGVPACPLCMPGDGAELGPGWYCGNCGWNEAGIP